MPKRTDDVLYSLPETSAASRGAKIKLDALIREAHSLRGLEKRKKEVSAEIVELIQAQGLGDGERLGCRSGNLCAVIRYQSGRRSLDKELLIENGVTPRQIEASMKEGTGYWICDLNAIGEVDS